MIKISKFPLLIAILVPSIVMATVFSVSQNEGSVISNAFKASSAGGFEARINGRDLGIEMYDVKEDQGDVIGYFIHEVSVKAYEFIDGPVFDRLADFYINLALGGNVVSSYDHVCFKDKKGNIALVAAFNTDDKTRVIFSEIGYEQNIKGYVDEFLHIRGSEKVLSIEILSDEKTVNFGNFYRVVSADLKTIQNYYERYAESRGWEKIFESAIDGGKTFVFKKGGIERVLSIYVTEEGEKWVNMMG